MHTHCEIVIPPTDDVETAIRNVLAPFDETAPADDDGDRNPHTFWDFWVIGGRWSGNKLLATLDKSRLSAYNEWLTTERVTVSGLQCGKQELCPAEQSAKVDERWREMFGGNPGTKCPLFQHSNDQYAHSVNGAYGDVMLLKDVPGALECGRIIFAEPSFNPDASEFTGPISVGFMLQDEVWNGHNHMKVDWDGTFGSALAKRLQYLQGRRDGYVMAATPGPEWLVVTVDYHS